MKRQQPFRVYLRNLSLGLGGLLSLVVALNALVNPFNLYAGPRLTGFNDYKYELFERCRLSKAAEVRRLQPDCLILGSSRAQFGFDPGHPAWRGRRAYNLAIAGGSLYEVLRYFQHAVATHPPQEAVVALDLFMFNACRPMRLPGFEEQRLLTRADGSANPDVWSATAYDLFTSLLSWPALEASARTVLPKYGRQRAGPEDGYWEYRHFEVGKPARHSLRRQFLLSEWAFLTEHWFPAPRHTFQLRDPEAGVDTAEYLRALLSLAHRERVRLTLLVSPAHARQWEALYQGGLWATFEEWKRDLVRINDEEARRAGGEPFPLWDFSGFDPYSTEELPGDEDPQATMRWFWESSHFRKALGERVLDRVLDYQDADRGAEPGLGARLTQANLDAHLAGLREEHARWRAAHPRDVTEIEGLVQQAKEQRRP